MKKLILTLLVTTTSLAAFAQGKISFANDSLHLYYMGDYPLPSDAGLIGQPIPANGLLPSGRTVVADLYGGSTAGSLAFITTATFSSTPGRQNTVNITTSLIFGSPAYFQVHLRDSSLAPGMEFLSGGNYFGFSQVFTVVPSSTIAFNSIVSHGGTAQSTWTDGTFNLGASGFGAIAFASFIPEPSALALTGLGISALLLRRNRNPEV